MAFHENKLIFVILTTTTTTKIWEFSSKWRRRRQKLTNFPRRDENYDENVSDESDEHENSTHTRGDSTSGNNKLIFRLPLLSPSIYIRNFRADV